MWEPREQYLLPQANERFVLHPVGEGGDKGILGRETRKGLV